MKDKADMNHLLDQLSLTSQKIEKLKRTILTDQQLNVSSIHLISIIGEEVLTLKEITEKSGLDKSTVSRQMNYLVNNDLVLKKTGEDRRFSYFELTDQADTHYKNYMNHFIDYLNQSLIAWSEEEKQMLTILLGRLNHSIGHSKDK